MDNKIQGNLLSPGYPCHSSSANVNEDKLKFIKPDWGKFYWVRYEFQCEKDGTTIKVLPVMRKKKKKWSWGAFVYIFEVCLKWSKDIYAKMQAIKHG